MFRRSMTGQIKGVGKGLEESEWVEGLEGFEGAERIVDDLCTVVGGELSSV